ncbi:MAG: GNAT family N-acetyltransferase [Lachnospiraceae bacterium]|nr:GNAT family N-acetyltransferase [Lachnospiraceae bacterium]
MTPVSDPLFETPHLIVRPFRPADAQRLYEYHLDENVKHWFPNESYEDLAEAEDAIGFFLDCVSHDRLPYVLAVEFKETGELIGDTGVSEVEGHPDEVEIGYVISDAYTGKGYATELASAMNAFVFAKFGLQRVCGRVLHGNDASVRVLEKSGFSFLQEEMGAEDDPYGNGMLVYVCDRLGNLFLEMHPGFFRRDYVKRVSEEEPASEMLLDLREFDPAVYEKSLPDNVSFGFYDGPLDALIKAVDVVMPHWVPFFSEDSRVYCGFVDGEIASFCMIEDFGEHVVDASGSDPHAAPLSRIGGPGCVGTVPAYRDRGIGLTMIRNVTQLLREEGYDFSHIHYTYETAWYGKLGYRTFLTWSGRGVREVQAL